VATAAPRLPPTTSLQQEDPLPLHSLLAFGWNMGKDARCPAKASAGSPQEKPLSPAQPSSTVSRSKRPGWEESNEDTMEARRSKGENATCWSKRRVWCSKGGSTAQR